MAGEAYYLSAEDLAILRDLLGEWKGRRRNHGPREHIQLDDGFAPEVYFAYIPAGIPAMVGNTVSHTPGVVYRILDGQLTATAITREIHNPNPDTAVPTDSWVPVWRDKFGTWVTQPSSGGSGSDGSKQILITGVCFDDTNPGTQDQCIESTGCKLRFSGYEVVNLSEDPACPIYALVSPLVRFGPGANCLKLSHSRNLMLPPAGDWPDNTCTAVEESMTMGTIHEWYVYRAFERVDGWFIDDQPLVIGVRPTGEDDAYGKIGFVQWRDPNTGLERDGQEIRYYE